MIDRPEILYVCINVNVSNCILIIVVSFSGSNTQFSKLLAITRGQVVEHIVERERVELQVKLAEDEHEPEACFIREALESKYFAWVG